MDIKSKKNTPIRLGGLFDNETKHQAGSVWDKNAICPTIDTMMGGYREPIIIEEKDNEMSEEIKERFFKQAYETFKNNDCEVGDTINAFNKSVNKSGICPTLTTRPEGFKTAILPVVSNNESHKISEIGQISNEGSQAGKVYNPEGVSQTICACTHGYAIGNILDKIKIRIRKLTPRECWKLMGLTFEDCDKAADMGVSNSQLYKQAGNGIITNCCELIAEHLYKAQYDNTYICTDEKMQNFTNPQAE